MQEATIQAVDGFVRYKIGSGDWNSLDTDYQVLFALDGERYTNLQETWLG